MGGTIGFFPAFGIKHSSTANAIVGMTYIEPPGFIDRLFGETRSHFVHYDVSLNRVGTTYIEPPGFIDRLFGETRSHFVHYAS